MYSYETCHIKLVAEALELNQSGVIWLRMSNPNASERLCTVSFAEARARNGHREETTRMISSHISLRKQIEATCMYATIDSRIDSKAVEIG